MEINMEEIFEEQCLNLTEATFDIEMLQPEDAVSNVKTKEINIKMVDDVCQKLLADPCLPSDLQQIFKNLQREEILPKVLFLNSCMVQKSKFIHASKEKSWKIFYEKYDKQKEVIAAITKSPAAAYWLCLRLMQELHEQNYEHQQKPATIFQKVSAEEEQILHHIGGFIVHKLEKKLFLLKVRDGRHECLQNLKLSDHSEGDNLNRMNLTDTLDRGGLVRLNQKATEMFICAENVFRSWCDDQEVLEHHQDKFLEACFSEEKITDAYYTMVYHVTASDKEKENTLYTLLKLFFVTRIHHKCKHFMDKYRFQKQMSKKQKGIRKTLKK